MADINIERKSKAAIWPWIVGLLTLGLLIFGITRMTGERSTTPRTTAADTMEQTTAAERGGLGAAGAAATMGGRDQAGEGAVNDYVAFVDERIERRVAAQGQIDQTADHETTAEGLRRLAAALDDIANQNGTDRGQIQQHTSNIRQQADRLEQSDPQAMHSDMVRSAFDSAVQAMSMLDRNHGASLQQAAQRVQSATPLNNQMEQVRSFFRESRDAVRSLSERQA
jgi:hypothetical protein